MRSTQYKNFDQARVMIVEGTEDGRALQFVELGHLLIRAAACRSGRQH